MICPKCNSDLPENLSFCPNCGCDLRSLENNDNPEKVQQGESMEQADIKQPAEESSSDVPEAGDQQFEEEQHDDGTQQYGNQQQLGTEQQYNTGQPFVDGQPFVSGQPYNNGQPFINGQPYNNGQPFINGQPYNNGQPFVNGQPYYGGQIPNGAYPYNNMQPPKKSKNALRTVICVIAAAVVLAAALACIKIGMNRAAEKRIAQAQEEAETLYSYTEQMIAVEYADIDWNWDVFKSYYADDLSAMTGIKLWGDDADGYVDCIFEKKGTGMPEVLMFHYYSINAETLFGYDCVTKGWVYSTEEEQHTLTEARFYEYELIDRILEFDNIGETNILLLGFEEDPLTVNECSYIQNQDGSYKIKIDFSLNRGKVIDYIVFRVDAYDSYGNWANFAYLNASKLSDNSADKMQAYHSYAFTWNIDYWNEIISKTDVDLKYTTIYYLDGTTECVE